MTMLYIVMGTTGEYSDRAEWPVAAYADEILAQCHVAAATAWYQKHNCFGNRHRVEFDNPFDPDMGIENNGTRWYLDKVELRDALPVAEGDKP